MDIVVEKENFKTCKAEQMTPIDLKDGQVLLKLTKFAFTANNITYAVAGKQLYWKFFPHETNPDKYGRIPVWGIA
jgi:hypothetical protein